MRRLVVLAVLVAGFGVGLAAPPTASAALCAYPDGDIEGATPGGTATARVYVACRDTRVTLVVWPFPRPFGAPPIAVDSRVFPGDSRQTLSVPVPSCSYQIDLVIGEAEPPYDGRLLRASIGGSGTDCSASQPPPGPSPSPTPGPTAAQPAASTPPGRGFYCLNGQFLDLELGQPERDSRYAGATPAVIVEGVATCVTESPSPAPTPASQETPPPPPPAAQAPSPPPPGLTPGTKKAPAPKGPPTVENVPIVKKAPAVKKAPVVK
jgi:hypothetical protein